MGKVFTGIFFDDATTTRIIYASAAVLGVTIDPDNPIVEGVLPNWKIRIEGILPPRATENPMFFIRRPLTSKTRNYGTDYNQYPDVGLDNGGNRRLALDVKERQQGKNRLGRWQGAGRDR